MAARACTFVTMTAISALSTLFVGLHNLSRQHNIGLGSTPVWAPGHFGDPPDNNLHEWFAPTTTSNGTPSPTRLADTTSPSTVPFTTLLLFFIIVFGSIVMGSLMACKKHRQAGHQHDYMAEDAIGLIGARYDGVADSRTSYRNPFIPATSRCPSPQTMANGFTDIYSTFATPVSRVMDTSLNGKMSPGQQFQPSTGISTQRGLLADSHSGAEHMGPRELSLAIQRQHHHRPAAEHDYGEPDDYEDDDDDAHGNPIDNGTGNGTSRESKVAVVTDSDAQRGSDAPAGSPVPVPDRGLECITHFISCQCAPFCAILLPRRPPRRLLRRLPPPAAAVPPLANRNDKPCLLPPGSAKRVVIGLMCQPAYQNAQDCKLNEEKRSARRCATTPATSPRAGVRHTSANPGAPRPPARYSPLKAQGTRKNHAQYYAKIMARVAHAVEAHGDTSWIRPAICAQSGKGQNILAGLCSFNAR
ncbi:hypothetical protein BKA62DRAFT_673628 [Auriculariales sp. MPI-PUGE-AT-0066]|nr:hypothetical protein BKA62DRAFT_673628 [Auriculariales sp. MPI-PUGE-AT-0066]